MLILLCFEQPVSWHRPLVPLTELKTFPLTATCTVFLVESSWQTSGESDLTEIGECPLHILTFCFSRNELMSKNNEQETTWTSSFTREWFELRSNVPLLKKIVWVIRVLRRTVVCDWRFDNLGGSHLQSQVIVLVSVENSKTLVSDMIGQ